MSTNKTLQIDCADSGQTERLGELLGANLKGGEVLELVSDLGGGKTTFVRGLARGMGSQDHVSSPTFKLSNVYGVTEDKDRESWNYLARMYHFDFYRLPDSGQMGYELHDAVADPNGVVVVEWGLVVAKVLPRDRVTITFNKTGDDTRRLDIDCPTLMEYLLVGVA